MVVEIPRTGSSLRGREEEEREEEEGRWWMRSEERVLDCSQRFRH